MDAAATSHLAPIIASSGGLLHQLKVPAHLQHGRSAARPDVVSDCTRRKAHHDYAWFQTSVPIRKRHLQRRVWGHPLRDFGEHQRPRRMLDARSRVPCTPHNSDSLHTNKLAPVPIIDATHVRDEAIFITGAHSEELVANILQVANIVDKTVSAHGMAVNWDPGKTEVIVLCSGKRTRACKHECTVAGIPGVLLENGRVCRFVQYKHLGSLVSAHSIQVRWLHTFYLRCLRRMGKFHRAPFTGKVRLSDAEVLKEMRMPSVLSLLSSRRVGYAMSLLGLLSAHDEHPDQWSSRVT